MAVYRRHAGTVCACGLLALVMLAVLGTADEKEQPGFRPKPAEAYPARDAHEGLIVAAEPFDTREKAKPVFGKHDLAKAGILPVLVVIANTTDKTVRLENLTVQLITRERQKIEPTPAGAVLARLKGKIRYPAGPTPSRIPRLPRGRDSEAVEVVFHEFSMRLLPPEATASGFFYFDVGRGRDWLPGSKLFVTQLFWAHNGQPLMYFEINLDDALRAAPPRRP